MDNIVYDNGSFCVFEFTCKAKFHNTVFQMYGIRRTDRPQDGMIFAHTDYDYVIRIADKYKKELE